MRECDVIVVGAGSAGCVVAARLSEDPRCDVVLLEAGPDYVDPSALPADLRSADLPAFSHDWGYQDDAGVDVPRARVVGGCSATNATFALRGAPSDYDGWAAAVGGDWSFDAVLPWFRRIERDLDFGDRPAHGADGPLPVTRVPRHRMPAAQRAFLAAAEAASIPTVPDHNEPGAIGAGPLPRNAVDGVRWSAARAWLAPARERPNLVVRAGALVDRVLLEGTRAAGVVLAGGETLRAVRIVLCAGAYATPAILMRSGIGDIGVLRTHGIEARVASPAVGLNLADHPLCGVAAAVSEMPPAGTPSLLTMVTVRSQSWTGTGPDLQVFLMAHPQGVDGQRVVTALVSVTRPVSRGRVALRSADPLAPPRIDLAHLIDDWDATRMAEGLTLARRILRTPPLASLASGEVTPATGGPSIADLVRTARAEVGTYHHPVGTCRMGRPGEATAVVGVDGAVHGTEGLSVVDASVMPDIPSANTNLATLMLAERLADRLRAPHPSAATPLPHPSDRWPLTTELEHLAMD